MDFAGTVLLDLFLNDRFDNVEPVLPFTDGPMVDRAFLEPVKFVDTAIDGDVTDEMENVIEFVAKMTCGLYESDRCC